MSNSERLMEALAPVFGATGREVDDDLIASLSDALDGITGEALTGSMTGDDSFSTEFSGGEGLREAWTDWLDAFAHVRIAIESVEEVGDCVITFVNQVGTTRHGVEISQPSAAVWKFRDGLLVRIEFHLDRDRARASARALG